MKKILSDQRGGVILEFTASMVIIILLWAGMCNFALVLADKLTVSVAAREAGRTTAVTSDPRQGQQRGRDILNAAGIGSHRATININVNDPQPNMVRCEVIGQSPVAVPGMMTLFGGKAWEKNVTVTGTSIFRLEP